MIDEKPVLIARHLTAMVRHTLSQPMSLAVRHGIVQPGTTVFDFGCGQGNDLRILASARVEAAGWDPHFAPEATKNEAQIVNLGFVLNVIEDPTERLVALKGAWALARQVLIVSVMITGAVPVNGLQQYGDGYLTARGTFQKYFRQIELTEMITQTTGVEPVALAPGIVAVFRSPEDEQDFLLRRRSGRRISDFADRFPRQPQPRTRVLRPALPERIPLAIAEIADFIRQRGRLPHANEVRTETIEELANQRVSLERAIEACFETTLSQAELENSASAMKEDLLVHYALGLLSRSKTLSRQSATMVRDIRTHFGSQKEFTTQSMRYLHGLANDTKVREAIQIARNDGLGVLDQRGRLVVIAKRSQDLPGILRCYLGCATCLAGEPVDQSIIRIDPIRKQVTMWSLVDPENPFPRVESAIRVDLRRRNVSVSHDPRKLLRKSELEGRSPRCKQHTLEQEYREKIGQQADSVFEKLPRNGEQVPDERRSVGLRP